MNKEKYTSGSDAGFTSIEVGLEFHKTIDYERNALRRALTSGAADVRKEARRLVSRRAISLAGQNPGLDTGQLMRSIGVISRSRYGDWIKVGPRTFEDKSLFYPAILYRGSGKMNIDKRNNYMAEALQNKRETIRNRVRAALKNALIPR